MKEFQNVDNISYEQDLQKSWCYNGKFITNEVPMIYFLIFFNEFYTELSVYKQATKNNMQICICRIYVYMCIVSKYTLYLYETLEHVEMQDLQSISNLFHTKYK